MSRDSSIPSAELEVLSVQRRRRFSAAEKQRMVQETNEPGMTEDLGGYGTDEDEVLLVRNVGLVHIAADAQAVVEPRLKC